MRSKVLVFILGTALASLLLIATVEYYWLPNHSVVRTLSLEKPVTITTPAFTATKTSNIWVLTLIPTHYPKAKSFSVMYNDTFYGVYLLTDKIYLPALTMPKASVVITALDDNGDSLTNDSFTLGE